MFLISFTTTKITFAIQLFTITNKFILQYNYANTYI